MPTDMRMLNLGCGDIYHTDWVNVDLQAKQNAILGYDLRLGIPFADASFDVVYHAHLLEYMPKPWAEYLLRECYRVLKPGGTLRVVVADFANMVQAYMQSLVDIDEHKEHAHAKHGWMLQEILTPLISPVSNKQLNEFAQKLSPSLDSFIQDRLGTKPRNSSPQDQAHSKQQINIFDEPKHPIPPSQDFLSSMQQKHWMYDYISLSTLFTQCKFTEITKQTHITSFIPQLQRFELDSHADGSARHTNSIYLEAKKQQQNTTITPRIAMLCTADHGGAGNAAVRLHDALRLEGMSSNFYVAHQRDYSENVYVIPAYSGHIAYIGQHFDNAIRSELQRCSQKLHHELSRYPNRPEGCEHFSIPAQCLPLEQISILSDFDILHLHWISGLCDPSLAVDFLRNKKIVWTLHDMNAMTGGCHYNDGCRKFEQACGACPQLGSTQNNDLANQTWRLRMQTYKELDLHIVTPSSWLAKEAKKSALLKNFPIHTIAYAQPLHIFRPMQRESLRASLNINQNRLVLLFASQVLNNRRKGAIYLLELLQVLVNTPYKDNTTILLLGNANNTAFSHSGMDIKYLGHINDNEQMAAMYNIADATIVPSLEDNQPNVICESLACGTAVVAFAAGGISEMIKHKETGFLVEPKNLEQLIAGVQWAHSVYQNPITRRLCRAYAMEQYNMSKSAKLYQDLYANL